MSEKLHAAIVCNTPNTIEMVYGEERLNQIAALCDLDRTVVTAAALDKTDLSNVDIIFSTWGMICFSDEQLDRMPKLKAVFYAAGATDYFSRPLLKRGIQVISAWKANAVPVAEFTTAQIILGLKNYFNISRDLKCKANWNQKRAGCGSYGETVALLGAGAISTHVQELLKSYNLNVIVIPSHPERRTISLEEAFRTAKVVSSHLPDRDDNVGVLNGKLFSSMREDAVFINTGRGRQINEDELCDVMEKRPDLTALLDVTYPEPPEDSSRLYSLPNVYLTPHIAGSLNDEYKRMADFVIGDMQRYLKGEAMKYVVSEEMLLTSGK